MKSRSHAIGCYNDRIAQKFHWHLGTAAAEVSVKFQSDWKRLNPNIAASKLREILREDVLPLSEYKSWALIQYKNVVLPV